LKEVGEKMELGWVDFSRDDRNKIMKTLSLLEEHTAVDELGIGIIRDGFANILFPGTSTLHTRAKYLVLTPYLFSSAEKQNFKATREVPAWIAKKEYDLVGTLIANSTSNSETGIIGKTNYGLKKSNKAKPSAIYWSALRTFEILKDERLTYKNACDIVYAKSNQRHNISIQTEGETFDDSTAANQNMTIFSPLRLEYSLDRDTSINLTVDEAKFLFDKITTAKNSKDSLLAYLLSKGLTFDNFEDIASISLPEYLQYDYELACNFADFIYGAHIRYNVIYSDYKDEDMIAEYTDWRESFPFEDFSLSKILSRVNGNFMVNTFLEKFLTFSKLGDDESTDKLIINREHQIKHDRAKLCNSKVYPYNLEKPIHHYKLNYRYPTVRDIANDILSGFGGEQSGKNSL
jgi:hypothetical protein